MIRQLCILLLLAASALAQSIPEIDTSNGTDGVVSLPSSVPASYRNIYNRYTKVTTPNGKAIHIMAQNQITHEQILYARSVLEFWLTAVPGSTYGSDKSAVANKMAENNAFLSLLNGSDDGNPPSPTGQPQRHNRRYLHQSKPRPRGRFSHFHQ